MKILKFILIFLGATAILSARGVLVSSYYHPKSEPRGLYIVEFSYAKTYYTYRMYCPTGEVRDITRGHWGKARKAYKEDKRYFNGAMVLRSAYAEVCN
ncbi:MAG: hypothetical protein QM493_03295 [Sulfurovum sp.]